VETIAALAAVLRDGGPWVFLAILGMAYWRKDRDLAAVNARAWDLLERAQR